MMKIVNPAQTGRWQAFQLWNKAPMPMCTLIKTFDISSLVQTGRSRQIKLNALLLWCIGRAASEMEEFFLLPVDGCLAQYDHLALSTVLLCQNGTIQTCDIPYHSQFSDFYNAYLQATKRVVGTAVGIDLSHEYMVIGTSALVNCEIDGAVNMYSGLFNNPFLIWGKYRDVEGRQSLSISFQFHHVQFDGLQAGAFLNRLEKILKTFELEEQPVSISPNEMEAE